MEKSLIFRNNDGEYVVLHECKDDIRVETNIKNREGFILKNVSLTQLKCMITDPGSSLNEISKGWFNPIMAKDNANRDHIHRINDDMVRLKLAHKRLYMKFNELYLEWHEAMCTITEDKGITSVTLKLNGPTTIIPMVLDFPVSEFQKLLDISKKHDTLDIAVVNEEMKEYRTKGLHCKVNGEIVYMTGFYNICDIWGLSWNIKSELFK